VFQVSLGTHESVQFHRKSTGFKGEKLHVPKEASSIIDYCAGRCLEKHHVKDTRPLLITVGANSSDCVVDIITSDTTRPCVEPYRWSFNRSDWYVVSVACTRKPLLRRDPVGEEVSWVDLTSVGQLDLPSSAAGTRGDKQFRFGREN
jgi:hypothetical protein